MELSKLEFAVNTDQLKEAVDLLGKVQVGTAALGKEEQSRAGKRQKLTAEEKAANEEAKKAAAAAKATAKAAEELGDNADKVAKKVNHLQSSLEYLRGDLNLSATGFSQMQAKAMATFEALGADITILKEVTSIFDNFNKITGQNKFDKSVQGLKFIQAEAENLNRANTLLAQGFNLTATQVKLLSRDIEGLTQIGKQQGQSEAELKAAVDAHTKAFAESANALNVRTAAAASAEKQAKATAKAEFEAANQALLAAKNRRENQAKEIGYDWQMLVKANADKAKEQARANKEADSLARTRAVNQAKAIGSEWKAMNVPSSGGGGSNRDQAKIDREIASSTKWLANERAKMISVLETLNRSQSDNNGLNEKGSRSIANFEKHLRQVGITGAAAAKELELYRSQQAQIQAIEQKNQGKFLSRALQPQIGDVAVSLAAGQNPLTVLLQQGDQVRGLIAQSGLKGKELQMVMATAFKDTLSSVKDTAVAMGSVVAGAFSSVGKTIGGFATNILGAAGAYNKYSADFEAGAISQLRYSRLMEVTTGRLMQSTVAFAGLLAGTVVVGLGILGLAAYQASEQEDKLSKSLILTGGSMGLTKDAALDYAKSLNGISTSKAIDVMTAMAKEGGFLSSEIALVTTTAVKMQKDAGIAIEDTVKHFAKLKEKPVEAILELAKSSGLISSASLDAVIALQKQGDAAGAASLAMKISADVQEEQAARINRELSALGSTVKWFADTWEWSWNKIKDAMFQDSDQERLTKRLSELQDSITSLTAKKNQWWTGYASESGKADADAQIARYKAIQSASAEELKNLMIKQNAETDLRAAQSAGAKAKTDEQRLAEDLQKRNNSLLKDGYTRQQAINAAITAEAKLRKAAGGTLSSEEVQKISSVTGQEFDKSKSKGLIAAANKEQSELNKVMNSYNDIMGIANDYSSTWNDQIANLDKGLAMFIKTEGKAGISAEQYADAREKLFEQQPYAKAYYKAQEDANKQLIDDQKMINDLIGKGDDLGKNFDSTMKRLESYKGKAGIDQDALQLAIQAMKASTPAAKALVSVEAEHAKTMQDVAAARKEVQASYSADFVVDSLKKETEALAKYYKSSEQAEAEYEKNLKTVKGKEGSDDYNAQVGLYKSMMQAKKDAALGLYEREKYLQSETFQLYSAGFDALKGLAKDFGAAVTDEFINFATTGKSSFEALTSSFGSMVQKMIYDLIRLRIQKQVTGLFDQLITMGVQAMMGPTSSPTTSPTGSSVVPFTMQAANGAAFTNGVQMYAKGGVFDSPTMFQHSGGLGVLGEAGSEAVMPLKRDSSGSLGVVAQVSGGSSATSVVINNYSSEKATSTESVDSRGNRSINVVIGDVSASNLSKSGSSSQKAMQSTYGMTPSLIRR